MEEGAALARDRRKGVPIRGQTNVKIFKKNNFIQIYSLDLHPLTKYALSSQNQPVSITGPDMFLLGLHAALMMNSTQKIPVVFSSTDINRLSIKNGRIKNVFGADFFQVEKDEETGQIFLNVKEDITLPDEISMAFVTDNGITQDLLVSFKDEISTPVVFAVSKKKPSVHLAAKKFLHDVLTDKTSKYVRQDNGTSEAFEWGSATFKHRFLSRDFTAEIFEVTGKKKCCTYNLKHRLFLKPQVCGVYLSTRF